MEKCVGCSTLLKNATGFFSTGEELANKTYICEPCSEKVRTAFRNMNLGNVVYFKSYTSFQIQELLAKDVLFQNFIHHLVRTYDIAFSSTSSVMKLFLALIENEWTEHASNVFYGNIFGILLATNKRLMFIRDKSNITLPEIIDYRDIVSVDFVASEDRIDIGTPDIVLSFSGILKQPGLLSGKIKRQVELITGKPKPQTESSPNSNDLSVFDVLERLGGFRQKGIITDEEFAEQKKKLLERL